MHCGAVLAYSDAHVPLATPLWGTKLRALFTFVGGTVLLSAIDLAGGRVAALIALGIAVVIFGAVYCLSPRPAYDVVNRAGKDTNAAPTAEPGSV